MDRKQGNGNAHGGNGTPSGRAAFIREYNRWLVANLLRREGPLSRVDLAERLGLSAPAVSRIVEALIAEGFIAEMGLAPSTVGRRPRLLQVRADAGIALGIDLRRVTRAEVGLVDALGNLIASEQAALPSTEPEAVLDTVAALARHVIHEAGPDLPAPLAAGAACPGVIDYAQGRVEYSAHLGWRCVPVKEMLEARLEMPVLVDTDCNAPALAESWLGEGASVNHLVYLTLGPGLGAGMIIGGALYRGAAGAAGELGHSVMQVEGGGRCRCGYSGCVETLLSDHAIVELARDLARGGDSTINDITDLTVSQVFTLAEAGDRAATRTVETVARYTTALVVSILNLLNPEMVVLDGQPEVVAALLPAARRAATECALPLVGRSVRIQAPTLGEKSVLVGAAMLVLERFWQAPVFDISTTYHELAGTRSIGRSFVVLPIR